MRIAILGAGPAGLYLAYLIKRRQPDAQVEVFEQNPRGATFGFGVVFSDRALEFLRGDDPDTAAAIEPHLESWHDISLDLGGERIVIDGVGFTAIGRLALLDLLLERARSVGDRAALPAPGREPRRTRRGRSDRRRRRRELAGPPHACGGVRQHGQPADQPLRLVRHHQDLRDPEPDLSHRRARALQRAPLPLCARHEHVHRRGRPGDVPPRRLRATCRRTRRRRSASGSSPTCSTAIR